MKSYVTPHVDVELFSCSQDLDVITASYEDYLDDFDLPTKSKDLQNNSIF